MDAHRSEPYDPYLPRGGASSGAGGSTGGGQNKTAAIQQQIDDTVGIMRENITKVAERGERLDSLQDKTGESALSSHSSSCCARAAEEDLCGAVWVGDKNAYRPLSAL